MEQILEQAYFSKGYVDASMSVETFEDLLNISSSMKFIGLTVTVKNLIGTVPGDFWLVNSTTKSSWRLKDIPNLNSKEELDQLSEICVASTAGGATHLIPIGFEAGLTDGTRYIYDSNYEWVKGTTDIKVNEFSLSASTSSTSVDLYYNGDKISSAFLSDILQDWQNDQYISSGEVITIEDKVYIYLHYNDETLDPVSIDVTSLKGITAEEVRDMIASATSDFVNGTEVSGYVESITENYITSAYVDSRIEEVNHTIGTFSGNVDSSIGEINTAIGTLSASVESHISIVGSKVTELSASVETIETKIIEFSANVESAISVFVTSADVTSAIDTAVGEISDDTDKKIEILKTKDTSLQNQIDSLRTILRITGDNVQTITSEEEQVNLLRDASTYGGTIVLNEDLNNNSIEIND